MDPIIGGLIFIGVVAALWIAFSNDRLASAIRAAFTGAKARAADAVDNEVNRIAAAEAKLEGNITEAKQTLVVVKGRRMSAEDKLRQYKEKSTYYRNAADNAMRKHDEGTARQGLVKAKDIDKEVEAQQKLLNVLTAKEQEAEAIVSTYDSNKADLKRARSELLSRADVARVAIEVNKLIAGIDKTGQQYDLTRAKEIVDQLEVQAAATGEVANSGVGDAAVEHKLAQYAEQSTDIDEQLDALKQKYNQATDRLAS